jgi:hypothetical protein
VEDQSGIERRRYREITTRNALNAMADKGDDLLNHP